jgi:hypothetical protein
MRIINGIKYVLLAIECGYENYFYVILYYINN